MHEPTKLTIHPSRGGLLILIYNTYSLSSNITKIPIPTQISP